MSILLVQLAKLGPTGDNLIDIEIEVPNNYNGKDVGVIKTIITSPDNLPCKVCLGPSPKQYKGDLRVVLIVNIISGQQIIEQYEAKFTGKLCSNYEGEECLLKEWAFILNTENSSIVKNTNINFVKVF
ncbi:MAG: hypothetical protein IKO89_00130 [Bacteroidales bacterium]|nr:hypothetical protein [Bacteroidales bacterium]